MTGIFLWAGKLMATLGSNSRPARTKVRREIGEDLVRLVAKRNLADYEDDMVALRDLDGETYLALNLSQEVISDLSRL